MVILYTYTVTSHVLHSLLRIGLLVQSFGDDYSSAATSSLAFSIGAATTSGLDLLTLLIPQQI